MVSPGRHQRVNGHADSPEVSDHSAVDRIEAVPEILRFLDGGLSRLGSLPPFLPAPHALDPPSLPLLAVIGVGS